MIDILVLNYNDARTTTDFVESVKNFACVRHILVVDNHSTDNSLDILKKKENDKVIVVDSGKNAGYGAGNNFGIRYLCKNFHSEYILLSNPDVIVEENVVAELEKFLRNNSEYAIAAPFMLNSKGEFQNNTAMSLPSKWKYIFSIDVILKKFICHFDLGRKIFLEKQNVVNVDAVAGSLFMMNAEKMVKFGMFDESIFLYCEEIVLGKKIQNARLKCALLPSMSYIHNHSISISKNYKSMLSRQRLLMKSKSYVIKNYFCANRFDMAVVKLLTYISFLEIMFLNLSKKVLLWK